VSNSDLVCRFDVIGIDSRPLVGGKAASLGELTKVGIPVPPGCVVTTAAFEAALNALDSEDSIRRGVEQLDADDSVTIARVAAGIRRRVATVPFPAELRTAIAGGYHQLAHATDPEGVDAPVAIRSSATSEDSAEASFAGLQDTHLWVRGEESVIDHVRRCWASLYSDESVSYRRRLKLPERGLAMGVVIQRMVDARAAGVMFTRSPITGDRSVVMIDASWGLGSAVVSGEVTPDAFVVNKVTGDIVRRTISSKLRQHRMDPCGAGVIEEDVPAEIQEQPCLSDEEVGQLVEVARRVEGHYGAPQDIEWAVARERESGGAIFILQSRPETVWATPAAPPPGGAPPPGFDHVFDMLSRGAVADRDKGPPR